MKLNDKFLIFAISDNRNSSYTGPRVFSQVNGEWNVGSGKETELKPVRFSTLSACWSYPLSANHKKDWQDRRLRIDSSLLNLAFNIV